MNVVVIGSGGREHALAYKIKESKQCENLFIVPGNAGTKSLGTNVQLNLKDREQFLNFCKTNKIDLVVIGPEQPLVDGLSDYLRQNGMLVFGPGKDAAQIEADKSFAKYIMKRYNIPTAAYEEFSASDFQAAVNYLQKQKYPIVIKANGLAAGKGVIICQSFSEAKQTLDEILLQKIFGDAGNKVVIEEFMSGEEASIFAITDGNDFITLPAAQDHKRIGDNDAGKNTGGMGSYAPTPLITDEILKQVEEKIIKPAINGLKNEGIVYTGCLYCGLMITNEGPKVVEFNCRFGDPETQAVLPILEGDILELFKSVAVGKLNKNAVKYNGGTSVCVVTASEGYPDKYETGFEIKGLAEANSNEVVVFHAGTKSVDNKVVTSGGRVLGVTSFIKEKDFSKAIKIAYEAVSKICYDNIYYRKDIAGRVLKYLKK
jgi:phosphoribosylamine--glycine ligase